MANRVLGIEIGENLTRVVEIDYKSKKSQDLQYVRLPDTTGDD
mgnify:FL=1